MTTEKPTSMEGAIAGFAKRYLNRHIILEIAPGLVFFFSNQFFEFGVSVFVLLAVTAVCIALGLVLERRTPAPSGRASYFVGSGRYYVGYGR